MGFLDKAEGQGRPRPSTSTATRSPRGIDKAAETTDEKTGGKHHDKIGTGTDKAKDALDKLDGKRRRHQVAPVGTSPGRPGPSRP